MKHQRIDLDRVLQGGPEDELYIFTYRTDRTELQTSIEKSGLLVPPVLKEHDEKTYRVVCGSQRIKILCRLGWQAVDAFVVSSREGTDVECLSRSILENRWHRGFNDVEKALLFTRLHDRFFHLLPRLADTLGEDLKMPRKEKTLKGYRFILSLPAPILDSLAEGSLSLGQALLLESFPADTRLSLYGIMTDCRLTLQESRRAAEWILEAAGREGKGPREFLEEDDTRRIMNVREAPRQKAQRLFSLLRKRRYPLMESWKARFASACSQMGIQEKGIQISHDPTFETTQIKAHVQAESEPEFRRRLEILSEATRTGKIQKLFQALSSESNKASQEEEWQ